jgi:hypothetical protein
MEFVKRLRELLNASTHEADRELAKAEVCFFLYFDEAHILARHDRETDCLPPLRSKYHLLGRVLGRMNSLPFFTVFLSTNSWLRVFAPASSTHNISSLREWSNAILHTPFTELPFDTFARGAFHDLTHTGKSGIVTLQDVCQLDYIVKFGRPLSVCPLRILLKLILE